MPTRQGKPHDGRRFHGRSTTRSSVARYRAAGPHPAGKTNVPGNSGLGCTDDGGPKLYGPAPGGQSVNQEHTRVALRAALARLVPAGHVPRHQMTVAARSPHYLAGLCCGLVGLKPTRSHAFDLRFPERR